MQLPPPLPRGRGGMGAWASERGRQAGDPAWRGGGGQDGVMGADHVQRGGRRL